MYLRGQSLLFSNFKKTSSYDTPGPCQLRFWKVHKFVCELNNTIWPFYSILSLYHFKEQGFRCFIHKQRTQSGKNHAWSLISMYNIFCVLFFMIMIVAVKVPNGKVDICENWSHTFEPFYSNLILIDRTICSFVCHWRLRFI